MQHEITQDDLTSWIQNSQFNLKKLESSLEIYMNLGEQLEAQQKEITALFIDIKEDLSKQFNRLTDKSLEISKQINRVRDYIITQRLEIKEKIKRNEKEIEDHEKRLK